MSLIFFMLGKNHVKSFAGNPVLGTDVKPLQGLPTYALPQERALLSPGNNC